MRPIIGITVDNKDNRAASGQYESTVHYSRTVAEAGGLAVLLPHEPELASGYVRRCDGLILTGGVDPDTSPFGDPLHAEARPMDPRRQAFEIALLDAAAAEPDKPLLGICLGMQLMALHAGGSLDQFLPDTLDHASAHAGDRRHRLVFAVTDSVLQPIHDGPVVSAHRQAIRDPGSMRVVARATDGTIEAIDAQDRRFFLGVQWHPERGGDGPLNQGLIHRLAAAANRSIEAPPPPPPSGPHRRG